MAGNRYIGPVLHDDQDTKLEEAEFEKFKMEIREKKIWEFHYEAAEAGARLSRQLCDRTLDKQEIRDILAEHDHGMEVLKRTKEDERRSIVDNERAKRQTEFRRRNALHDATAKPWKPFEAVMDAMPERDLEKELRSRGGQRLARDLGPKQLNGEKPAPQSTTQPHRQIAEEVKTYEDVRRRRTAESAPVASTSRQAADSVQNSLSNSSQPPREDIWMLGMSEQKKKASGASGPQESTSKKPVKITDQPPFSQQSQVQWADAIRASDTSEAQRRDGNREKEAATKSMKTVDVPSGSKSRRKSLLQTPREIWVPDGHDGSQDLSGTDPRRKLPASIPGATLDAAGSSSRNQVKREDFWVPTQRDATAEPAEPKQVAGSSTKATGSLPGAKLPQASTARGPSSVPDLRQGWPVESSSTKFSNASLSAQPPRDPDDESRVGGMPPSSRVLEKQKQNVNPGLTHEGSSGLDTAQIILSRSRRASDPPPPSPNLFEVPVVQKQKSEGAADVSKQPKSILKKADRKTAATNVPPERKKGDGGAENRKRGKGAKKANPPPKPRKPVTVEDVSDEDADPVVRVETKSLTETGADHQPDSGVIAEPKPSIPPSSFSQIFQYKAEEVTAPPDIAVAANVTAPASKPEEARRPDIWYPTQDSSTDVEDDDDWNLSVHLPEERTKAKHVRWTPSVLSNGGHSSSPDVSADDALMAFRGFGWNPMADSSSAGAQASTSVQKAKPRNRASSLMQSFEMANEVGMGERGKNLAQDLKGKGKGKEKPSKEKPTQDTAEIFDDGLAWYAREAMESLKAMRSKPASAV